MPNTLKVTGTATLNYGDLTQNGSISNTTVINGTSNGGQTLNLSGSTWIPLATGSLSNYLAGWYSNLGDVNGSGSVNLATGSAGQNLFMKLPVGISTTHYWDGINPLSMYAQVAPGTSTGSVQLQYILTTS